MPQPAKHAHWGASPLFLERLSAPCVRLAFTPHLPPPLVCSVWLANLPRTQVLQSVSTARLALTALAPRPPFVRHAVQAPTAQLLLLQIAPTALLVPTAALRMPPSAKHARWVSFQRSLARLSATCAPLACTPPWLPPLACSVWLAHTPTPLVFRSASTARLAFTALPLPPFIARHAVWVATAPLLR